MPRPRPAGADLYLPTVATPTSPMYIKNIETDEYFKKLEIIDRKETPNNFSNYQSSTEILSKFDDNDEKSCFADFDYNSIDKNPKHRLDPTKFLVPILIWGPNNQVKLSACFLV